MYKRIDFSKLEGLATYQDTLDFLQTSYRETISAVAKAFGSKVIVTGVTDQGTTNTDGWVIIDGELMPFAGGFKTDRIVVEELTDTEIFNDGSIQTVYYTKRAKMGITGGFAFSDFIRVDTLSAISQGLKNLVTAHNNLQTAYNAHYHTWDQIWYKPQTFDPSPHRHNWSDIDNIRFKILHVGTIDVEDFSGDRALQVPFPQVNTTNYIVVGSLVSESDWQYWAKDNDATWTVKDKRADNFHVLFQKISGNGIDIRFDYALISF